MVKNHSYHTFEAKYLLDYRILKILNDSTLLIVTPNGKERKTNIYDVKPYCTTELVENAWDSFLGSIKTKHQNSNRKIMFANPHLLLICLEVRVNFKLSMYC